MVKQKQRRHTDITSKRFGRLVAIQRLPGNPKHLAYLCHCDCGTEKPVAVSNLTSGRTVSCGCQKIERTKISNSTHKMSRTFEYGTWQRMRARCTNPKNKNFRNYGARGIKVCERWDKSFENFFADMGKAPPHHSIDRIDNDGNYEPGNCRWATKVEQNRNTRRCRAITAYGHTLRSHEWERITGIPSEVIIDRLLKGWTEHKAVTKPLRVIRKTQQIH